MSASATQPRGQTYQQETTKAAHQNSYCLDPYRRSHRQNIVQDKSVIRFLLDACENAHVHPGKMPLLPGGETKHNKSKVAATIRISDAIVLEITGLLGSGSFARVYSVTTKLNGASQVLALKVLTDHEGTAEPVLLVMYPGREENKILAMGVLYRQSGSTSFGKPRHTIKESACISPIHKTRYLLGSEIMAKQEFIFIFGIVQNGSLLLMEKSFAGTLHGLLGRYRRVRYRLPSLSAQCKD